MKNLFNKLSIYFFSIVFIFSFIITSTKKVSAGEYNPSATTINELSYVSLGDSMVNGFGLIGYENSGFLSEVEGAFPVEFSKYLAEAKQSKINLTQLAMSNMRVVDLLNVLDFEYYNSSQIYFANKTTEDFANLEIFESQWNNTFNYGDYFTFSNIITTLSNIGEGTNEDNLRQNIIKFQDSIKNADIISLGIGSYELSSFLYNNLISALGVLPNSNLDLSAFNLQNAIKNLPTENQELIIELSNNLSQTIAENMLDNAELCNKLTKVITYSVTTFILGYEQLINKIVSLNNSAEIILIGLINSDNGFTITQEDGTIIDIGQLQLNINKYINTYLSAIPSTKILLEEDGFKNNKIYFAEPNQTEVIFSQYNKNYDITTKTWKNYNNVRGVYLRNNLVNQFNNLFYDLVKDTFNSMLVTYGFSLSKISIKDVHAYEQFSSLFNSYLSGSGQEPTIDNTYYVLDENGYTMQHKLNYNRLLSASLYLAVEQSILAGVNLDTINMQSLLKLTDGLDVVIGNVTSQIKAENIVDVNLVNSKVEQAIKDDMAASIEYMGWKLFNSGATTDEMISWMINESSKCKIHLQQKVASYASNGITPTISTAMQSEESLLTLFNLFARLVIDNGVGSHPTTNGYAEILNSVISSYENNNTVLNHTASKVKDIENLVNQSVSNATNNQTLTYNEYIDKLFLDLASKHPTQVYDYCYCNISVLLNEIKTNFPLINIEEQIVTKVANLISFPFENSLIGNVEIKHTTDNLLCFGGEYSSVLGQKLKLSANQINNINLADMQIEDIVYILDNNVNVTEYTKNKNNLNLSLKQEITNKIKNSKIITLDFSTEFFNDFALSYYNKTGNFDSWSLINNKQIVATYKMIAQEYVIELKNKGATLQELETFNRVIDAYLFSFLSYEQNCEILLSLIKDINPNAQVVLVGISEVFNQDIAVGVNTINLKDVGNKVATLTNFALLENASNSNNVFVNKGANVLTNDFANCLFNSINPTILHNLTDNWQTDNTYHWQNCTCGEEVKETHNYIWVVDKKATTEETGLQHQECEKCLYQNGITEEIPKLPKENSVKLSYILIGCGAILVIIGCILFIKNKN